MAPMTFLAIGLPFCGSLAVARSKARLSNLISQCGGSNRNISRFSPGANSAVNVTCEPRASDPAAHWPRRHPYKTSQISMSSKGKLCKTLQLWKFRSVQILHLANSFCVQIGLHFHHLEQWSPYLCFPSRPASPTRYAMCHRALASSHAFNAKICTAMFHYLHDLALTTPDCCPPSHEEYLPIVIWLGVPIFKVTTNVAENWEKKHHCRFAHIELNAAFRSEWTEEVAAVALCGLKLPPPAP